MWQQYFKLPFKNDWNIYIHDANDKMVCNFIGKTSTITNNKFVSAINGEYKSELNPKFTLSEDKSNILINDYPILLMRGWGYLTGSGACALKPDIAIEIQNSLAEFICEQLNKACNKV